jgi:hypothetical protein
LTKPTARARVFIDARWFVRWPHQAPSWAERQRPRRIPKDKSWKRGERPPRGAVDTQLDAAGREGSGAWHPTWNQEEIGDFLQGVIAA